MLVTTTRPSAVKTGNTLWVDAVNGNDSTAVLGRLDKPYKTLAAARNVAAAVGAEVTVVVLPGFYSERDLLRDKVHWYFEAGASVYYLGTDPGGIFDDTAGAVQCKISGHGQF